MTVLPPGNTAVAATNAAVIELAERLARQFGLPYIGNADDAGFRIDGTVEFIVLISVDSTRLMRTRTALRHLNLYAQQAHDPDQKAAGTMTIDFTRGAIRHRQRFGGGKQQPIARATGISRVIPNYILDITAGTGTDAYVLASLGASVLMLERQPAISLMLTRALQLATVDSSSADAISRLNLVFADSADWMNTRLVTSLQGATATQPDQPVFPSQIRPANRIPDEAPDVIFMDPMYPVTRRTALARQPMQFLQLLAGPDENSTELLELARRLARKRVVVKRPISASEIGDIRPDTVVESAKTRYDIYLRR